MPGFVLIAGVSRVPLQFLKHRNLVPEQMDADDVDPRDLAKALRFIRQINQLLRYNLSVVKTIARMVETIAADLPADRAITVLDVGAGSGDLLVELSGWSARSRRRLQLFGLDRHAETVAQGSSIAFAAGVRFVRGDALALPLADRSIDIVVSTLFLHHLSEPVAANALAEMARVARRGVIVADLLRTRRAYAWISLLTLFASRMVKHDARASVAHAFTLDEARSLAKSAGMDGATIERTFAHRFMLIYCPKLVSDSLK